MRYFYLNSTKKKNQKNQGLKNETKLNGKSKKGKKPNETKRKKNQGPRNEAKWNEKN
jgi:hypothetical protein